MRQIFISHSEEDGEVAMEIAAAVEGSGFSTWYYERDSLPGPAYLDQVCEAISQCEAVILVISRRSLKSRQVDAEVIVAFETEKHFVPVLLGVSHGDFQKQKPAWRMALGAATSIGVPGGGVSAILDRLRSGVRGLGIKPAMPLPAAESVVERAPHRPPPDGSQLTVFARPEVIAGDTCLIHVWLHRSEHAEEVERRSLEFEPSARRRGAVTLDLEPAAGARLGLEVQIGTFEVRALSTELTWQEFPEPRLFNLEIPANAEAETTIGKGMLLLEGTPLASVKFKMRIAGRAGDADGAGIKAEAVRKYRKAFLCYASQDRTEVLRRAMMLRASGLEVAADVLNLTAGDNWEQGLKRLIDEADAFFLFWSTAARNSQWVEREWRYALESRGAEFIHPVVLESPLPPPPPELMQIHFSNSLAYSISSE